MKNIKKMMAIVIVAVMTMMYVVPMSFAAATAVDTSVAGNTGTGKITVTQDTGTVTLNDRVFRAYKILDIQSHNDDYSKIAYTVPEDMLTFWTDNNNTGLSIDWTGVDKTATSSKIDQLVTNALKDLGDDSAAIKAFAEKAQTWLDSNGKYYSATGANNKVEFTNLPLGYYIVDDQTDPADGADKDNAVSAVILDTTTPEQTIVVKATLTTSDKSISGFNTGETGETNVDSRQLFKTDTTGKTDVVDVSVGDIVHFNIDSKVPDTRGYNYYKYVLNDTMDKGLKLDVDTVKVKIGDSEYTNGNGITVTTNPSPVTGEGQTTLKIVLNDALAKFTTGSYIKATGLEGDYILSSGNYTAKPETYTEGDTYRLVVAGDPIVITYDAELLDKAPVGQAVENKVTIDYTNNPKEDIDTGSDDFTQNDPKGTTPEDKTKTYTTELTIQKVDENGAPLANAEFTLSGTSAHITVVKNQKFETATTFAAGETKYWKLKDGSYTTQDPNTRNSANTGYEYDRTKYDGVDTDPGTDLNLTTYKLTETSSVTDDENADQKVVATTDGNGVVTFSGLSEGTYIITETGVPTGYNGIDPITVNITFSYNTTTGEGTFATTSTGINSDGDNTFSTTIVNRSGSELPSTGGIGTTLFYLFGTILVLGAGVLMVTRRRMKKFEQ